MKIHAFYFLLFFVFACHTPKVVPAEAVPIQGIILDNLVADDLSEDMSRMSTHEDEVYAFAFVHDRKSVKQRWHSGELLFSTMQKTAALNQVMIELGGDDHCTFFVLELDNETLPTATASMLESWVLAAGFPESFQPLRADSLLGDDDLLGMRSFKPTHVPESPLVFRGRQLFDAFRYELYFSTQSE